MAYRPTVYKTWARPTETDPRLDEKKEGKKNWGKHHGGLNPQNEEGSFHLKCRIAVFFH